MLDFLNDLLWSKVLIAVLLNLGVWFTLASRFVQFRYFSRMFRILGSKQAFKKTSTVISAPFRRFCYPLRVVLAVETLRG